MIYFEWNMACDVRVSSIFETCKTRTLVRYTREKKFSESKLKHICINALGCTIFFSAAHSCLMVIFISLVVDLIDACMLGCMQQKSIQNERTQNVSLHLVPSFSSFIETTLEHANFTKTWKTRLKIGTYTRKEMHTAREDLGEKRHTIYSTRTTITHRAITDN